MSKMIKGERDIADRILAEFDEQPSAVICDRIEQYAKLLYPWNGLMRQMRTDGGPNLYRGATNTQMFHKQLQDHGKAIDSALGRKSKARRPAGLPAISKVG